MPLTQLWAILFRYSLRLTQRLFLYNSSAMLAENFFIMCRSEWIPTSRAYPVFYFRIGYGADEIGAVLAHGAGLAELCTESGLILRAGDEGSLSHDRVPFYIAFYGLLRRPLAW